jgi:hypothetical protein
MQDSEKGISLYKLNIYPFFVCIEPIMKTPMCTRSSAFYMVWVGWDKTFYILSKS